VWDCDLWRMVRRWGLLLLRRVIKKPVGDWSGELFQEVGEGGEKYGVGSVRAAVWGETVGKA